MIKYQGRYFLTYNRWATRQQVKACWPQLPEFLELKRKHDPEELFQSDWYRHYNTMVSRGALLSIRRFAQRRLLFAGV